MSLFSAASGRRRNRNDTETSIDISNMQPAEILQSLIDMRREAADTRLENGYLERYLERNNPELLLGVTKMMERHVVTDTRIHFAPSIHFDHSGATNASDRRFAYKSRGDGDNVSIASTLMSFSNASCASMRTTDSTDGVPAGLSYAMKIELVEKDCHAFEAKIEQLRTVTKAELCDVAAQVEELKLTNQEAVETLAEFRDFVMTKGLQPDTKRVPLERCLKFFDKWVIHGNGMIEQMRLRTATLKQDIGQKEKALAIKAELSGILLPVDFEQLEIERLEFQHTFAEKESHLLGLKRVTGNVSLALTTQRKLLVRSKTKLAQLQRKIKVAQVETERFDGIREAVEDEIEVWQDRVKALKDRKATYLAPTTMEYIHGQVRRQALEREARMLLRQETIALIKEKNVRAKLRRKRATERHRRLEHSKVIMQTKVLMGGATATA